LLLKVLSPLLASLQIVAGSKVVNKIQQPFQLSAYPTGGE